MLFEIIKIFATLLSQISIVHIARPYRNMNDDEKHLLKLYYQRTGGNMSVYPLMGVNASSFILPIALLLAFVLLVLGRSELISGWITFAVIIISLGLLFFTLVYEEYLGKVEYDKKREFTMPVYTIQGKPQYIYENEKLVGFHIDRYSFSLTAISPDVLPVENKIPENTAVTLEFSPLTHFVWKVTKL